MRKIDDNCLSDKPIKPVWAAQRQSDAFKKTTLCEPFPPQTTGSKLNECPIPWRKINHTTDESYQPAITRQSSKTNLDAIIPFRYLCYARINSRSELLGPQDYRTAVSYTGSNRIKCKLYVKITRKQNLILSKSLRDGEILFRVNLIKHLQE